MSQTNRAQFALLGLLTLGPMTGYDVKNWIERSIGYFWSESYGQIYPQLKRLVAQGLARVQSAVDGGRQKKIYRITAKGRRALRQWLQEPTPPPQLRLEFLLKVFFAREAELSFCVEHLQREHERAKAVLALYEQIEGELRDQCDGDAGDILLSLITLDYGKGLARHTMRWAQASMQKIGASATKARAK